MHQFSEQPAIRPRPEPGAERDYDKEDMDERIRLALEPLHAREIEAYQGAVRALIVLVGAAIALALATSAKPQEPPPLMLGNPPGNRR